ncbi:MAG TPA: hypothetical protein VES67_15440 [Vicinamibacterales bacterium]|nr:hypothetical protein [Vicinamibacterales bacterium]
MADLAANAELNLECVRFARYLTQQAVSTYVLGKYRDAHARRPHLSTGTARRFDRLLVVVARTGGLGAWLVDAYTAVFFKRAVVRQKWVLLVAILESTAPTAAIFDVPDTENRVALFVRLAGRGMAFALGLGLSTVMFLPLQLLLAATSRGSTGRRA